MSDREFDNYLALVASLLRLGPRQRGAIADELRSHLEDRLEELESQGVDHDEAVRQALAEFGDAAGLAGQFVTISHQRRRRWLMRLMTFSICATIVLALGFTAFWPGRNAAPGVAAAVAQATKNADPAAPTSPPRSDPFDGVTRVTKTSGYDRIEAALHQPTNVDLTDMPLRDAVLFLQDTHAIPIYLSKKKLEEAGVALDHPVTFSLRGVPLSTALEIMLGELDLTYVIGDVLVITTPEDAESRLETRVYDCRDLITMPAPVAPAAPTAAPASQQVGVMPGSTPAARSDAAPGSSTTDATSGVPGKADRQALPVLTEADKRTGQLIELVTATVAPDSWDDTGGPGAIDYYNGLIVVSQTYHVHKQVEHVFDMLREAAGLERSKTSKVVR